jgi:hypothetical protein
MSASGLDVFDKTLQTTHIWLDALTRDESVGPNRQIAWHVLSATRYARCVTACRSISPRVSARSYRLWCAAPITISFAPRSSPSTCVLSTSSWNTSARSKP